MIHKIQDGKCTANRSRQMTTMLSALLARQVPNCQRSSVYGNNGVHLDQSMDPKKVTSGGLRASGAGGTGAVVTPSAAAPPSCGSSTAPSAAASASPALSSFPLPMVAAAATADTDAAASVSSVSAMLMGLAGVSSSRSP
jgi:hypothetical protein